MIVWKIVNQLNCEKFLHHFAASHRNKYFFKSLFLSAVIGMRTFNSSVFTSSQKLLMGELENPQGLVKIPLKFTENLPIKTKLEKMASEKKQTSVSENVCMLFRTHTHMYILYRYDIYIYMCVYLNYIYTWVNYNISPTWVNPSKKYDMIPVEENSESPQVLEVCSYLVTRTTSCNYGRSGNIFFLIRSDLCQSRYVSEIELPTLASSEDNHRATSGEWNNLILGQCYGWSAVYLKNNLHDPLIGPTVIKR